jgi:hypothetical protein
MSAAAMSIDRPEGSAMVDNGRARRKARAFASAAALMALTPATLPKGDMRAIVSLPTGLPSRRTFAGILAALSIPLDCLEIFWPPAPGAAMRLATSASAALVLSDIVRRKVERRAQALQAENERLAAEVAMSRKALDTERQWRMAAERTIAQTAANPPPNMSALPPKELQGLLESEYLVSSRPIPLQLLQAAARNRRRMSFAASPTNAQLGPLDVPIVRSREAAQGVSPCCDRASAGPQESDGGAFGQAARVPTFRTGDSLGSVGGDHGLLRERLSI